VWLAKPPSRRFIFHRIFRGMLGETPLEVHRRVRMERAAHRLLATDSPITAIAFDAGYDTHEAFTRAFRTRYSCSPSEFRQSRDGYGPDCRRTYQIEIAARSGIHFEPERGQSPKPQFIKGDGAMDVAVKHMPEFRTASVRHLGPYHRISEAFGRLGRIASEAKLLQTRPTMIAVYHDDPESTPEPELRSDAAIVVPEEVNIPAGLAEQRIQAGRYACTTHVGPYEQLGDVWARFMGQWLPQSGQRLADGVSYEIYLNTPDAVPQARLRTELYIPLE
jgi:AraC family transcriptional regulator